MSTIIKVIPVGHATKRTTMIRIPDDGQIATRVEDPIGTATDKSFDFSSYDEGTFESVNNEPVISVSSQKLGADARFIIAINEFYDSALEGDNIPQERFLWYSYTTAADDAPSDDTPLTATSQNPLYILWSSAGTPASPTIAFNIVSQNTTLASQYSRLGSVSGRRSYLKEKIIKILQDPILPFVMTGNSMVPIVASSTEIDYVGTGSYDVTITESKDHSRRLQGFIFRLEMLTRAISIDSNLESEQKFNLLDGEISLNFIDVFAKITLTLNALIQVAGQPRTGWHFQKLGSVSSSSPYTYTAPRQGSIWNSTLDTNIDIGSAAPQDVTDNWVSWLRNQV